MCCSYFAFAATGWSSEMHVTNYQNLVRYLQ